MSSIEIDRIIHAYDVIECEKKELTNMYVEDYGEEYRHLVNNRLENAIYLFDSTPDISYDFFKKYESSYNETEEFEQLEKDANEYRKILNNMINNCNDMYFKRLCDYFGCSKVEYQSKKEEMLRLPIELFSTSVKSLEHDYLEIFTYDNSYSQAKEAYFALCDQLGLSSLDDSYKIDELLKWKAEIFEIYIRNALKDTAWFQKKQQEISKKMGQNLTARELYSLYNGGPVMRNVYTSNNNIVYLPLAKYFDVVNLDAIFLHENRHLVECGGDKGIGISLLPDEKYRVLNEIRTEKCALKDAKSRKNFLFTPHDKEFKACSAYSDIFPVTVNLFENNSSLFNKCAIRNDIETLEMFFGKSDLEHYNDQVTAFLYANLICMNNQLSMSANANSFFRSVEVLEQNAAKNKKLIFPKL